MTAPNTRTGTNSHFPQVMSSEDRTYQYGVIVKNDWNVTVWRRNLATEAIDTFDIDSTTIAGNPLALPIYDADDHHALAIGVHREAGGDVLHIAGNSHGTGLTFNGGLPTGSLRYIVSAPGSISSWSQGSIDVTATGANAHTYHIFNRLSDGTLLWFFDQQESTSNSRGRDWLAFKRAPLGTTWTPIVGTGEFAQTTQTVPTDDADRVYITGVVVDANDRVHVAGIWRTDDANADTQKRPWYIYSDDLVSWKAVDGTAMTVPITWSNFTAAEVTSAPAFSRNYGQGISLDANGYPSMIHQVEGTSVYARLYWTGAAWAIQYLTTNGLVGGASFAGSAAGPNVHCVRGHHILVSQGSSRVRLRDLSTSAVFFLGGEAGSGFEANPDPIAYRLEGVIEVCVPDGDTPVVRSYGAGARKAAA